MKPLWLNSSVPCSPKHDHYGLEDQQEQTRCCRPCTTQGDIYLCNSENLDKIHQTWSATLAGFCPSWSPAVLLRKVSSCSFSVCTEVTASISTEKMHFLLSTHLSRKRIQWSCTKATNLPKSGWSRWSLVCCNVWKAWNKWSELLIQKTQTGISLHLRASFSKLYYSGYEAYSSYQLD